MSYSMAAQGVYRSAQGEGALLGEPTVFVRLAGCSIGCAGCDTNYRPAHDWTPLEIAFRAVAVRGVARWAWITGGEPTDHDLGPLADALRAEGFLVAVATAGVRPIPNGLADWISVSPHSPGRPVQSHGHEVKLIAGLNGLRLSDCDPRDYLSFPYRYAGGCAGMPGTEAEAEAWINANHGWRLSVQAHKRWGVA